ncbi:MAG: NUDIX hydrolase N-terminal domain-containing protein [Clostridia bacterium]
MAENHIWLDWAVELQSLAQAGLYYSKDPYDLERFQRIRDISAEIISFQSEMTFAAVKDLFCGETGYQTPKLDCRAAIFQGEQILLVKENNGAWSLPGGWVDAGLSVRENVIKEVKEEAGLDVTADRIIAVQDRDKHNTPVSAYKICKIFVLCSVMGGAFRKNIETLESGYFPLDRLPVLALEKNNEAQISMCFDAYRSADWQVYFD